MSELEKLLKTVGQQAALLEFPNKYDNLVIRWIMFYETSPRRHNCGYCKTLVKMITKTDATTLPEVAGKKELVDALND